MKEAGKKGFQFGKSKYLIKAARLRRNKPKEGNGDKNANPSGTVQKGAEVLGPEESQRVIDRAMRHTTKDAALDKGPIKREIYRALGALERATLTIDSVFDLLAEARNVVERSVDNENQHDLDLLAQHFDELLNLIDQKADEATHEELNLVNGAFKNYEVALDLEGKARLMIGHANLTTHPDGFNLPYSTDVFGSSQDLETLLSHIDKAIDRLKWLAHVYCSDARVLVDHYKELNAPPRKAA